MTEKTLGDGAGKRIPYRVLFAVTVGFAVAISLIDATPAAGLPPPPGLSPGDEYHLVFMSSTTRDGTSGNIADYDAVVQAAADSAGIGISVGTSWSAMASTGSVNARDHAVISAPVYNLRSAALGGPELLATNAADMWDSALLNQIRFDESGVDLGTTDAWTGSIADGTRDPNDDYLGSSTNNAWCGRSTQTDEDWFKFLTPVKTIQLHVYGLSEVLTVPEPSSAATGVLGLLGVIAFCLKRSRTRLCW